MLELERELQRTLEQPAIRPFTAAPGQRDSLAVLKSPAPHLLEADHDVAPSADRTASRSFANPTSSPTKRLTSAVIARVSLPGP